MKRQAETRGSCTVRRDHLLSHAREIAVLSSSSPVQTRRAYPRGEEPRSPSQSPLATIMRAMSTMRAEYPYSLSYQTYNLRCVLSTTIVDSASTMPLRVSLM